MTNPLLETAGLPLFDQVRPHHVGPAVDQLLRDGDSALERAVGPDVPADYDAMAAVYDVQPFGNRLVRVRLRGVDLRAYLERIAPRPDSRVHLAGVRLERDTTRASGARLVRVTMADGTPLDDRREYRLILTDFMAEGGDAMEVNAKAAATELLDVVDRDAVAAWLRQQPQPVRPPAVPHAPAPRP